MIRLAGFQCSSRIRASASMVSDRGHAREESIGESRLVTANSEKTEGCSIANLSPYQVVSSVEGGSGNYGSDSDEFDQLSWGTLLYTLKADQ